MCLTQKFSFSRDPVILDLKFQLAFSLALQLDKKILPELEIRWSLFSSY
jgi:hypothetical protein